MAIRSPKLFIFGLGYSCLRFVELYGGRFASVAGTVRSPDKVLLLREKGIEALTFASGEASKRAASADIILISIPPDAAGDPVFDAFSERMAEGKSCRWLGYLSTTGVYGDRGGAWTDETAPVRPMSRYSGPRVQAEQAWLAWGNRNDIAVQIFRLTGIYGPGRSAFDALRRGTAHRIVKEGQVFNRIHVDDIAATLMASMQAPRAGGIYNVSDDEPAPPQDVMTCAARLAGVEPPPEIPFSSAEISPVARSFYSENKRICNRLIKTELGVKLAYPTYREGLAALL